ncbi:hypothetical protein CPB85DRAFT_1180931, partial [Mucidula mucida]
GRLCEAPSIETALSALKDLRKKLCPHCQKGPGHVNVYFDPFTHYQMLGMQAMLSDYTSSLSATYGHWAASSLQATVFLGRGVYCARVLCRLVRAFIADRTLLPINPYGSFKESMLANQDLLQDINLHLQELEKDITALKVVEYLAQPEVKDKYGITKTISLRTAQQYLNALGYRWKEAAKGQYVDGHERADVVFQRDHVYVPKMKSFKGHGQPFKVVDGVEVSTGKPVIIWFHDKSIFYAHNCRRKSWYHKDGPAKPYRKGEGASLMIADFVSAEFGWLRSPDGTRSAR